MKGYLTSKAKLDRLLQLQGWRYDDQITLDEVAELEYEKLYREVKKMMRK